MAVEMRLISPWCCSKNSLILPKNRKTPSETLSKTSAPKPISNSKRFFRSGINSFWMLSAILLKLAWRTWRVFSANSRNLAEIPRMVSKAAPNTFVLLGVQKQNNDYKKVFLRRRVFFNKNKNSKKSILL